MDDLISRQVAIDALDEQIEQCNKALGSFGISPKDEYAIKVERASLEAYKEQLENMPPAQPEERTEKRMETHGVCLDAISRKAAIDAIHCDIVVTGRENAELVAKTMGEFVDRIKALPTIQPEILACGNGELIAKLEPQWIPIAERLPKDGTWNIFTDGKNISVERYKADAIDHFFPPGRWFDLDDAVAWMPLPDPYKPNNK